MGCIIVEKLMWNG